MFTDDFKRHNQLEIFLNYSELLLLVSEIRNFETIFDNMIKH